jgi:uncharacterized protein (TIGR02147 family)
MAKNVVFNCSTFHQFLVQGIENNTELKRGEKKIIAEYLKIHPTLLSQILSGSRVFTDEQVYLLGEYFGLTDLESDYIFILHQIANTQNKKFKEKLSKKKEEIKNKSTNLSERVSKEKVLSDEEKSVFYSSWLYSGIRLFTSLEGGKTKEEIAERLNLDKKKTNEALDFLLKSGLCKLEEGKYYMHVSRTHVDKNSPYYKQHHTNWRIKSIQKLDRSEDGDMTFTGPLSVSQDDFDLLKEEMVKLIQRVSTVVKDSEAEDIYCLNLDFFKI